MGPGTCIISHTHFRKHDNYRQTGAVKFSASVDSAVQCGRLCSEDDKCESYNIVQQNGSMQCEISDADSLGTVVADVTSTMYGKHSFYSLRFHIRKSKVMRRFVWTVLKITQPRHNHHCQT